MNNDNPYPLGRSSAGFALAAAITVLFNTALALAKDAYHPLNKLMASLTGHHWTTHAVANLLVFVVLGFTFSKSGVAQRMNPNRLINSLIGAVTVASLGLVAWYLVY